MSDAAIQQLLYVMDQAFEDNREHSLLGNLSSVKDDDWRWVPPDGGRSIFDIVKHVGEARYAYDYFDVQTSDGTLSRLRFDHLRRCWHIDAVYD